MIGVDSALTRRAERTAFMMLYGVLAACICGSGLVAADRQDANAVWEQTAVLAAAEAHQAAAADVAVVYAISSRVVAKYDRSSGKRLGVSQGPAQHLNSGFLWKSMKRSGTS